MRLVFVHGMSQEGKDPTALRQAWEKALTSAWTIAGLPRRTYDLEMPFYGDVLNDLVEAVRGQGGDIVTRGEAAASTFTPLEETYIRQLASRENIGEAEVRAEIGQEIVARGWKNWEWVQGLARIIERRVPGIGPHGLRFVRQVDGYLTRPHIRTAVDDVVRPALLRGPTIVVAHSLGTIVSFSLLREAGSNAAVPLFVTLGSPLGIKEVKENLRPPALKVPLGVVKWLNGTDERDYVAIHSRLDRQTFAEGIENVSDIHNRREDAHAILDYVADTTVSQRIHAALA